MNNINDTKSTDLPDVPSTKSTDLPDLRSKFLLAHGYVTFDNIINIDDTVKIIDDILDKSGGVPKSREEATKWIKIKSEFQSDSQLLNLINKGIIKDKLENILGDFEELKSCQISYRFSGENIDSENIHIDNFTPRDMKRKYIPNVSIETPDRRFKEFDALVGVCLSDVYEEDRGNFTVFPGSHFRVQAWSRRHNGEEYFKKNGLEDMIKNFKSTGAKLQPHQLCSKKGDLIIANRFLMHLISAPNRSDQIRKIIWFRVKSKNKTIDHFNDIWQKWKFINEHDFINQQFYRASDLSNKIEELGYGYKSAENEYYIKSHMSIPNIFASMIILRIKDDNKNITIKTNGFISKIGNEYLVKELKELSNMNELQMCKYIYENFDYNILIMKWFPKTIENVNFLSFEYHHIKSISKTNMMKKWADELELNGYVKKGKPGYLYVEGNDHFLSIFSKRLSCLYWNKKPKKLTLKQELKDKKFFIILD